MKENVAHIVIASLIIFLVILIFCFGRISALDETTVNPENLYSINAEVIDRKENEIFIKDLRGEIWSFNSDLAWKVGDEVTAIFDTLGTNSILDDKIISVDWLGQWEG